MEASRLLVVDVTLLLDGRYGSHAESAQFEETQQPYTQASGSRNARLAVEAPVGDVIDLFTSESALVLGAGD